MEMGFKGQNRKWVKDSLKGAKTSIRLVVIWDQKF